MVANLLLSILVLWSCIDDSMVAPARPDPDLPALSSADEACQIGLAYKRQLDHDLTHPGVLPEGRVLADATLLHPLPVGLSWLPASREASSGPELRLILSSLQR